LGIWGCMVEDVGFRPRRLIYAHPPPRAEAAREAEAARQAAVEKVRLLGVVVVSLDAHFLRVSRRLSV